MNNIVEDTDGFYYWDDSDDLIGPFKSSRLAEIAYGAYLKWAAKDHHQELHKMREHMGS